MTTRTRQRRFGNKVYHLEHFTRTKRDANGLAKQFRSDGFLARVTSDGPTGTRYQVWVSKHNKG